MRVAYMMSRFPKLTETFVLYEMLAVEGQQIELAIYPLMREKAAVVQAEAKALVERAKFSPFISLPLLVANLEAAIFKAPKYWKTLWTTIRANWGSPRFLLGNLAYFPKAVYMAKQMQADKIDHIHAHFASFPAAAAYMIHQLSGIPYSFTAHGSDLHRDQHMLLEKIRDARFVIAISEYNRQMMIEHSNTGYGEKIHVVRCGINLERFKPEAKQDNGKELSIICVGSLHEVKGQRYLLEACSKLKEWAIPFQLHFVGGGEDLAMLEQLATDLGIREQVHFHGNLPQAAVLERLKLANVAALTSVPSQDGRREGIPVALMEAMACALPVVSTRLSGIPELVTDGETGLLTEARDSAAIADALRRFANDPAMRKSFGEAGRHRVEEEFELNANAAKLATLFRKA